MTLAELKTIAAACVLLGIVLNFLSLRFAPSALLLEQSPNPSPLLKWGGWAFASTAAVLYLALDYFGGSNIGATWKLSLPYLLGFAIALGLGQIGIGAITGFLWAGLGLPNKERYGYWHSVALGLVEGTLYVGALLSNRAEFIAVWLGIKTVISWRHWESDIELPDKDGKKRQPILGRTAFNLFLLGNALVILYAAVGWKVVIYARDDAWFKAYAMVLAALAWTAAMSLVAWHGGRQSTTR